MSYPDINAPERVCEARKSGKLPPQSGCRTLQEKLPQTILVISDMEFDRAVWGYDTERLFESIKKRFARYSYLLPKLVIRNVNSRTGVVPVRENEYGTDLFSGFSVNVCRMALSNELDPFVRLKKTLEGERYRKVEERMAAVFGNMGSHADGTRK